MRILKYIFAAFVSAAIVSCARVEDGVLLPDSLPYSFDEIESHDIQSEYAFLNSVYDSSTGCDYLDYFRVLPDSALHNKSSKAYADYKLGSPIFDADLITFKKSDYEEVEYFVKLPFRKDFNGNGTPDDAFIIYYSDSARLQIHDHKINSNEPYFKRKFNKEDGHLTYYKGYYQPPAGGKYIILRKTNRLLWKKSKTPDTLFFIDPGANFVKREPIGASPTIISDQYGFFESHSKYLIFKSLNHKNRHDYNGLSDVNEYLIFFDQSLNLFRVDTIYRSGQARIPIFHLSADSDRVWIGYQNFLEPNDHIDVIRYNPRRSEDTLIKTIKHRNNYPSIFQCRDFYYLGDGKEIKIYDKNFNLLKTRSLQLSLTSKGKWNSAVQIDDILRRNTFNPTIDVNGNGVEDLLGIVGESQICFIDGKTLKPLAALNPIESNFNYAVIRTQNESFFIAVSYDNRLLKYTVKKTPLLAMIKPHLTFVAFLWLIALAIPVTAYGAYRIVYFAKLFGVLSSGSEFLGVAAFKKSVGGEPIPIKVNDAFFDSLFGDKTDLKKMVLPKSIRSLILECLKTGERKTADLTFNLDEMKYFSANAAPIKLFGRTSRCVLTIADTTDLVKSEVLSLAISIAHDAKNELSEAQTRFESLMYVVKEPGPKDPDWLEKTESKISASILEVSGTLKKLLFAGEMPKLNLESVDLKNSLDRWIKDKSDRYERRNVSLKNEVPPGTIVEMDERHFGFLLQCACDNSANAIVEFKGSGDILFTAEERKIETILSIKDDGGGFKGRSPEELGAPRIDSSDEIGGLGVKIIGKVCDAHKAPFEYVNDPGRGVELKIHFKKESA